jgi:hypothetical protein
LTKQSQARNLSVYVPESRRRAPRVPVNVWVTVEHEGTYFDALAANVGLGGAFVETATVLPYGARLMLHLPLPSTATERDEAAVLRLPGIVRWNNQNGFGIQFLELGAKETHAISALVQSAS